MKELSIKDKAKRYDELKVKAQELEHDGCFDKITLFDLFPELEESEDEQHRKWILEYLYDGLRKSDEQFKGQFKCAIAWLEKQGEHANFRNKIQVGDKVTRNQDGVLVNLSQLNRVAKKDEKQGEQKPADKVEPKFKVGEWITHNIANFVFKIINIGSNGYEVVNKENYKKTISFDNEDNYHLWTIQDAKDGDVLLFEGYYNSIVLFEGVGINGKGRINYHCKCDLGNYSFGVQGDVACLGTIEKDAEHYHPATKEHRELLFKKMLEAGYTFDFENKKLKKIEQKPAWSEEEQVRINRIVACLENLNVADNDILLKDVDWLKSLKQRYTWKPSEEQMKALHDLYLPGNISYAGQGQVLIELYNDLKKLKE